MSLEAVQKVTETEQRARERRAEAAEGARRLVLDAEKAGRERLNAARLEAETKAREMLAAAEESAAKRTETVLEETRRSCDALKKEAEGKLPDAAALIVRRVVSV